MIQQSATWLEYKGHDTGKELIGISPTLLPVFTSDIYPGSISDEEIVRQSGMAYHGNRLLADKGFLIQDILDSYGVRVETPKKLEGIKQFSMEDAHNRNISQARVHVQQAIHRFKILKEIIPIRNEHSYLKCGRYVAD